MLLSGNFVPSDQLSWYTARERESYVLYKRAYASKILPKMIDWKNKNKILKNKEGEKAGTTRHVSCFCILWCILKEAKLIRSWAIFLWQVRQGMSLSVCLSVFQSVSLSIYLSIWRGHEKWSKQSFDLQSWWKKPVRKNDMFRDETNEAIQLITRA